eukprot:1235255-Rhodomonas_salina.3
MPIPVLILHIFRSTDRAYGATQCPVLVAYDATRVEQRRADNVQKFETMRSTRPAGKLLRNVQYRPSVSRVSCLRACYAMPGTDTTYGPLSAYVRAIQRPVLACPVQT